MQLWPRPLAPRPVEYQHVDGWWFRWTIVPPDWSIAAALERDEYERPDLLRRQVDQARMW